MKSLSHCHWSLFPGIEHSMGEARGRRGNKKIKTVRLLPLAREQNGSERKEQERFCKERQQIQWDVK